MLPTGIRHRATRFPCRCSLPSGRSERRSCGSRRCPSRTSTTRRPSHFRMGPTGPGCRRDGAPSLSPEFVVLVPSLRRSLLVGVERTSRAPPGLSEECDGSDFRRWRILAALHGFEPAPRPTFPDPCGFGSSPPHRHNPRILSAGSSGRTPRLGREWGPGINGEEGTMGYK